jgi:hypothetical protein
MRAELRKRSTSIKSVFVPKDRLLGPRWALDSLGANLVAFGSVIDAGGLLRHLQTEWSFPDGRAIREVSSAVEMKEHDA